ncbi:division/cell wall cluster transcriptional repressor MraZ [Eubacteriaceae bacterium ES2]|jgi:MraZ protein|nr:division/cell wall cluster transcriptional repressor MraZ [Eubacteriaceae bacterium ES2]
MFFGEHIHNIDDKGRLIIPSKFRESLGGQFVLTKGLDCCLFVFSMEEWENFEGKLKSLPVSDKNARAFTRFFFAGAADCELDRQGRATIPASLRKYAKISREVTIIGVSNRLEIWDSQCWESYNESEDLNYEEIAGNMAMLGI